MKDLFYAKITTEDIQIAQDFFENDKHLDEFLANVSRYYSQKNLTIKTKIVKKYFETYKKTMDFVMNARGKGKEGGLKRAENQEDKDDTLQGGLKDPTSTLGSTPQPKLSNLNKLNNIKPISKIEFEIFWDLYDKKVGDKDKIKKKWDVLSMETQNKIMDYIPKYKISTPNKQYRKNPEVFFNNKSWNDEIITPSQPVSEPFKIVFPR